MSILRLDGVRREIGDFVILDSVTAALARGERAGLVGGNGAGKTTLLEIVAGREEADGGRVHLARGLRIGLLAQEANLDEHFSRAPTVRAVVRGGAVEVERMERELAELEASGAEAVQSAHYAACASASRRPTATTSTSGCRSRWPGWASRAATGTTVPRRSPVASRLAWPWRAC